MTIPGYFIININFQNFIEQLEWISTVFFTYSLN